MNSKNDKRRNWLLGVMLSLFVLWLATNPRPALEPWPVVPNETRGVSSTTLEVAGWMKYSCRFIKVSEFALEPFQGATRYWARLNSSEDHPYYFESQDGVFNIQKEWETLPFGPVTLTLAAFNRDGKVIIGRKLQWHKAHPFSEKDIPPCHPLDMAEGIANYLIHSDHPDSYGKDRPAFFWHASILPNGKLHPHTYPAWGNALFIDFFLNYASASQVEENRQAARKFARELGDQLLTLRSPKNSYAPDLFYSTATNGIPGGQAEGETLTVTHSGHAGLALLALGEAENDRNSAWTRAAWQAGMSLLKVQKPDGSWPFRIRATDGQVIIDYTSNSIPVVHLLDALLALPANPGIPEDTEENRKRIQDGRKKALAWILSGPWKNMRWENMYEDVPELEPYSNLEWFDASLTVLYVLRHPEEFPNEQAHASVVTAWIEDQFLCWHPDDVPTVIAPKISVIPAAMEQYVCYKPIDAHASRALDHFASLAKQTGDPIYRHKARRFADALRVSQRPSGAIATWMWYDSKEDALAGKVTTHADGDWFRCMAYDGSMILKWRSFLESTDSATIGGSNQ